MREYIYIVTYIMLVMYSGSKSCSSAVEDDSNVNEAIWSGDDHIFFFNVWQTFTLELTFNQGWIAEFWLITTGSDKKCIHQNDRFQFQFWYQNQLIPPTYLTCTGRYQGVSWIQPSRLSQKWKHISDANRYSFLNDQSHRIPAPYHQQKGYM
jgi:hypothetical protein